MITRIIITILAVAQMVISNEAIAQSINYFSLVRIEDHGKIDKNCQGGQFVKISKYVCFDSDVNGEYVGNGKLYSDTNTPDRHVYIGESFHGKVKYVFNGDYSTLTIEISPQYRYIYKKSTIPNGVHTSSLIRKNRSGESSAGGTQWAPSQSGGGYMQDNNSYNSSGDYNTGNSTAQPTRQFKCAYCNGSGRIEKNDNAPTSFGQSRANKKCNECGKIYDPTVFTHYHVQCGHCGGTGNTK